MWNGGVLPDASPRTESAARISTLPLPSLVPHSYHTNHVIPAVPGFHTRWLSCPHGNPQPCYRLCLVFLPPFTLLLLSGSGSLPLLCHLLSVTAHTLDSVPRTTRCLLDRKKQPMQSPRLTRCGSLGVATDVLDDCSAIYYNHPYPVWIVNCPVRMA